MSQLINFSRNSETKKFEATLAGQSCILRIDFAFSEWVEVLLIGDPTRPRHAYVDARHSHRIQVDSSTDEQIKIICFSEPVTAMLIEPTTGVSNTTAQQVESIRTDIDTIVGTNDTTPSIDTINEMKDFLAGVDNTKTLSDVLPSEMSESELDEIKSLIQ